MPDQIRTLNSDTVCLISLKSFTSLNSFYNISSDYKNNTLIIRSTYINKSTGEKGVTDTPFTIPDGYYNVKSLVLEMNKQLSEKNTVNGFVNTFGGTDPINLPAFFWVQYENLSVNVFNSILSQSGVTQYTNTHEYISYSLLNTIETNNLLQLLGFQFRTQNINSFQQECTVYTIPTYLSNNTVTYQCVTNYSPTFSTINNIFNVEALYYIDFAEVSNIYINVENTVSQHRASFNSLRQTDFILSLPITTGYDGLIAYADTGQTVYSYNQNIALNNLHITLVDQLGRPLNFRGAPWNMQLLFEFKNNADNQPGNANDMNMVRVPHFNQNAVARPYGSRDRDLLYPAHPSIKPTGKRNIGDV